MSTPSEQDKPKSRLKVPQCEQCNAPMTVRMLVPRMEFDEVSYRCGKCRAEVIRAERR
jgi:hypothetical protein